MRDRSDQIFELVIKKAVEKYGYNAMRSDHESKLGMITVQIIQHMIEDELVIADLTGHNPNVFYELGIRHAFNKPCIQIKDVSDTLPFDIAGTRTIDVDYSLVKSMQQCSESIMRHIEEIEKDSKNIQSPLGFVAPIKSTGEDDAQTKMNLNILSRLQELNINIQELKSWFGDNIAPNINHNIFDISDQNMPLKCAHCKFEYLQLGKPVIHYAGDDYDKSNPLGTRGNWIEIPCQCEQCNEITTINVAFHKGFVYRKVYPKTTISQFENISRKEKIVAEKPKCGERAAVFTSPAIQFSRRCNTSALILERVWTRKNRCDAITMLILWTISRTLG